MSLSVLVETVVYVHPVLCLYLNSSVLSYLILHLPLHTSVYYTERKPKRKKNRGGLGTRLALTLGFHNPKNLNPNITNPNPYPNNCGYECN